MLSLYNALLPVLKGVTRVASLFSPKLQRGLKGRASLQAEIEAHYRSTDIRGERILIHVASYGELEQAKPVIAALRSQYPHAHIHLTFFSPSGYENTVGRLSTVDHITYAPIDTREAVRDFLDVVQPHLALFTRYDVWPNMALELARREIPSVLFSATASDSSRRMLPLVRSLHREVYRALTRILVISEADRQTFVEMGARAGRVHVAGDTRFDQVLVRRQEVEVRGEHVLPESVRRRIEEKNTLVFVLGSAWSEDEAVIRYTAKLSLERHDNIIWIIVPHEPSESHVAKLMSDYGVEAIRLSKVAEYKRESVIIVDSIGKLFSLYRYADLAMVGGGFGAGAHNVLEAAVWGVPAVVGPKHQKSAEIGALMERLAAYEVKSAEEFDFVFWRLAKDDELREQSGAQARQFVEENEGATKRILREIEEVMRTAS